MNENNENNEKTSEAIPNEREVLNVIEGIIGHDFEIIRSLEDEQGLYILEVKTTDEAGDPVQYHYVRAGHYPEGGSLETVIDVVYYMGDIPAGGHPVAKYIGNKWEVDESGEFPPAVVETNQNPNRVSEEILKGFYSQIAENLPEGFLGSENAYPVQIGANKLDVVIFGVEDEKVRLGIFVDNDSRQQVSNGPELPGHVPGKYSRKTLEINLYGQVTQDTSGIIPDFDFVKEEPDFGGLSNEEIAVEVIQQIRNFNRPNTH
jgi:hypothetical protein